MTQTPQVPSRPAPLLSLALTLLLALAATATPARAGPDPFRLDPERSSASFTYILNGFRQTGTMPFASARLEVDLDDISASSVDVSFAAANTETAFDYATSALRGESMLHTDAFPEVRFRATAITGTLDRARMTGELTIRGITRQVTLNGGLFRQRGTDGDNRDDLTILVTGRLNRHDFGVSGYRAFVGARLGLRVIARIERLQ